MGTRLKGVLLQKDDVFKLIKIMNKFRCREKVSCFMESVAGIESKTTEITSFTLSFVNVSNH